MQGKVCSIQPNFVTKESCSNRIANFFICAELMDMGHKIGMAIVMCKYFFLFVYWLQIFPMPFFGSVAGSTKSISRHISLVPEARKSLDNASTSQKLDWIGLQMRVPEYLENMRGVSREAMQNAATASSSFIQHGHRNSLVMNSFDGSAPNATNVTLEHQLASKSNMLSLEKRQSLSMMAFPASAKQWLLQSLRLQDSELQKLFNKVKLCVMFLV